MAGPRHRCERLPGHRRGGTIVSQHLLPASFALFIWWFSTGLIIFLDGLPARTFKWSMLGATAVLGGAFVGLAVTAGEASVGGAYWAFTWGLLAWGWQEISFYMGFVTGPRRAPCAEGCSGWRHFGHAIQTSLYHELAIIAAAAAVVALTWKEPNQVGTWTFLILWWMHQSAKLNVFLGVRNLNEEFLPDHLRFLRNFLRKKPMNLLFPVSVTVSTIVAVILTGKAAAPAASPFQAVGFTFLAMMMVLAILEHWFLVLPLPAAALWKWGLASRAPSQPFEVRIVAGFLGSGKTTVMRRLLSEADPSLRTVVLVNDFAAVGVDGSLLSGQGAEVVELPNGCICCSLRTDLSRQLKEAIARWAPRQVLIEPSGVADVGALLLALDHAAIKPLIQRLTLDCVIDAGAFLEDYARMPAYFAAQARLAQTIMVNKCDLVCGAQLRTIAATLRRLNPAVSIVPAAFGVAQTERLPASAPEAAAGAAASGWRPAPRPGAGHHDRADRDRHRSDPHVGAISGLTAWTARLNGPCDPSGLEDVLAAVARGDFGSVERMKGIARVTSFGWIHFDVAGGRPRMEAFAPSGNEEARVVAIGKSVDQARLQAAFVACEVRPAA